MASDHAILKKTNQCKKKHKMKKPSRRKYICTYLYIYIHISVHIYIYVSIYEYMYICTCIRTKIYMNVKQDSEKKENYTHMSSADVPDAT